MLTRILAFSNRSVRKLLDILFLWKKIFRKVFPRQAQVVWRSGYSSFYLCADCSRWISTEIICGTTFYSCDFLLFSQTGLSTWLRLCSTFLSEFFGLAPLLVFLLKPLLQSKLAWHYKMYGSGTTKLTSKIKEVSDILDIKAFGSLFALALLSLLPTFKPVQNFLNRVCKFSLSFFWLNFNVRFF